MDYSGYPAEANKYRGKPDYSGSLDEIVRYSIEKAFTEMIPLDECHGKPKEMFRSSHEYFIKCPVCSMHTKYHRHLYEAKQAWNRGERI